MPLTNLRVAHMHISECPSIDRIHCWPYFVARDLALKHKDSDRPVRAGMWTRAMHTKRYKCPRSPLQPCMSC